MENDMNCSEAGERLENPSLVTSDRRSATRFLRHARTCRTCREKYGMEKIAIAVHAVVMSLEESVSS